MNKGIVLGIVLLIIGFSFTGTTYSLSMSKSQKFSFDGNIFYVGGNGSGNYTTIQSAIDDASDGDTVFVYDGTYYENVVVNKTINLIGERKETTIINAEGKDDCIFISPYDGVIIQGFTVLNSGDNYGPPDAGFDIRSDYNSIIGNIVKDNLLGIYLYDASNNNISGNTVLNNKKGGIRISEYTLNNIIYENVISDNAYDGIALVGFNNNYNHKISRNKISFNSNGIYFAGSSGNFISRNCIESNLYVGIDVGGISDSNIISWNIISNHNLYGIYLQDCFNTSIFCNNLINNRINALFEGCRIDNKWDCNFWEKPRLFPKIIFGSVIIFIKKLEIEIPWFSIDWYPAQEPYNITTAQGCGIE